MISLTAGYKSQRRLPFGRFKLLALLVLTLGLLSACAPASLQTPDVTPSLEQTISGEVETIWTGTTPAVEVTPSATLEINPAPNTSTPPVVSVLEDQKIATVCAQDQCRYPGTLYFARPIAEPGNNQVDASYRFGSSQGKQRDPHHGVEFLNRQGTPVLAAADGEIVFAGDDKTTLFSPYFNYYGNLVVIQHELPPQMLQDTPAFPLPIYTLYAHLSEESVEPGQMVRQGQEIGKVGMTGGATGSHLHFEVRLGENSYAASHNPELWLQPGMDENGHPQGALAGRVVDPQGNPVAVQQVVIQHLVDGPGSSSDWEIYRESYEEEVLLGRPPWGESFAAGDLPPGWYRITFPYFGLKRQEVQVFPGQVTTAVFKVE